MKIIIIGDYNPEYPPHPATEASLKHAEEKNNISATVEWLDTEKLQEPVNEMLSNANAIWLGPAPYKNKEGVRAAVKYIRENDIPFIGTCGGLYQSVAEFALNKLSVDISKIEMSDDPSGESLFIRDTCCVAHGFKVVNFKTVENTKTRAFYNAIDCEEDSNCGFAVNEKYHAALEAQEFIVSGTDNEHEAKVFELNTNKFFIVTKFLPQMRSTPEKPHPLINSFIVETQKTL